MHTRLLVRARLGSLLLTLSLAFRTFAVLNIMKRLYTEGVWERH